MVGGVGEQWSDNRADGEGDAPRCAHCGRRFTPNTGVGRPGKYCRRSCRQRAFELRRHAGDQAWGDARLIRMSEQLAVHEDAIDRVRELMDEVRAAVVDEQPVDAEELLERLDAALELDAT